MAAALSRLATLGSVALVTKSLWLGKAPAGVKTKIAQLWTSRKMDSVLALTPASIVTSTTTRQRNLIKPWRPNDQSRHGIHANGGAW